MIAPADRNIRPIRAYAIPKKAGLDLMDQRRARVVVRVLLVVKEEPVGRMPQVALTLLDLALRHRKQPWEQHVRLRRRHIDNEPAPIDQLREGIGGRRGRRVPRVAIHTYWDAAVEQHKIEARGEALAVARRAQAERRV